MFRIEKNENKNVMPSSQNFVNFEFFQKIQFQHIFDPDLPKNSEYVKLLDHIEGKDGKIIH